MIDGHITVSEYAAIKHITKQAVYKQLNNVLKEHSTIINGKKHINVEILSEEEKKRLKQVEQPLNQHFQNVEQPDKPDFSIFENQIAEKDKTIDRLLSQIEALQNQNTALTELLKNSQVLLAAEKQQNLLSPAAPEHMEQPEQQQKAKNKKSIFDIFKKRN